MAEDAIDNLEACIQNINDFVNSAGAFEASKGLRKQIFSDLMIDALSRQGDVALFAEQVEEAITYFYKSVELCKEFIQGNERVMSSTLYTIGCCYQQIKINEEAGKAFAES
jgi:hypothetical protein